MNLLVSQGNASLDSQFTVQVDDINNLFTKQLELSVNALNGLQAFFSGSSSVDPHEFAQFVDMSALNQNNIYMHLTFAEQVTNTSRTAFENRMRSFPTFENFTIVDRDEADGSLVNVSDDRQHMFPVTYSERVLTVQDSSFEDMFSLGLELGASLPPLCTKALTDTINIQASHLCSMDVGPWTNTLVLFMYVSTQGNQNGVFMIHTNLTEALVGASSPTMREYMHLSTSFGLATGQCGADPSDAVAVQQRIAMVRAIPFNMEYTLIPKGYARFVPLAWMSGAQIAFCVLGSLLIGFVIVAVLKFIRASIDAIRSAKKKTRELNNAREVAEALSMLRLQDECITQLCDKKNLTQLEGILKKITINLREYVKFLPASLISTLNTVGDDEMEDAYVSESASESSSNPNSKSKSDQSGMDQQGKKRASKIRLKKNLSSGLKRKHITLLTIDISDTHQILRDCSDTSKYVDIHATFIDSMIQTVTVFGGDCIGMHADQLLFSWNAVSNKMNSETRGCEAACKCLHNFNQNLKPRFEAEGFPDVKLKLSVVSGEAVVGNVGNLHKSFAHFTPIYKRGLYLCKLNKTLHTDILVDDATLLKSDMRIEGAMVDRISWLNSAGQVEQSCMVHVLSKQCSLQGGDEWLYEIKDKLDRDDSSAGILKSAWNHMLAGEISQISILLESLEEDSLMPHEQISVHRLKKLSMDMLQSDSMTYCTEVQYAHC